MPSSKKSPNDTRMIEREKRRRVPLATIPMRMQQAVLAIEDQNFYLHPGVNPFTTIGAVLTNVFGDKPYLVGGSTINLMRAWKTRVYYDQEGLLVRKLGITAVPAIVSQEGARLRIDELVVQ